MNDAYYYHLQERIGDTHWYGVLSTKFDKPLQTAKALDGYFKIWQDTGTLVQNTPSRPLRIGVFSSKKGKRVDQVYIGTWRSLYQMYMTHGSCEPSVVNCLLTAGEPKKAAIKIQI